MWKIIVSVIMIALLLILVWSILSRTIVSGLNPILNAVFIAFGIICLGYILLIISRIENKKIRLLLFTILASGVITIYIYEKYFPRAAQDRSHRYYDVHSS